MKFLPGYKVEDRMLFLALAAMMALLLWEVIR